MARTWITLLLLAVLTLASTVLASSTVGISDPPNTDPPWPTDFPISNTIEPRAYKNQTLNRTFQCTNPNYPNLDFNLADPPNCPTRLSQDLYGWGVRIGFYTTWLASLFANFFIREEIRAAVDANSIFLFALEISVLKATFNDHNLMKVDALVLFLIGNGTAIGALSLWGRRTKFWYTDERKKVAEEFGGVGTYARLLLCFFLGLYGVWFWYSPFKPGLLLASSCDPRCWTAYILGTKLYSGVRWLWFVFALLSLVYWGGMLFLLFVCCFSPLRNVWRARYSRINDLFSRVIVGTGLSNLPNRWVKVILPAINLAWYIIIITIIEVTLHQNRQIGTLITAKASTSPAQLIPFLVGLVSLVRLIWVKCTSGYKARLEILDPFVVEEKNRAHSNSYLLGGVSAEENGPRTEESK